MDRGREGSVGWLYVCEVGEGERWRGRGSRSEAVLLV